MPDPHFVESSNQRDQVVRETEAEAIAFVVGKAVGLEAGSASADYIHLYHDNTSLLALSNSVAQSLSSEFLIGFARAA